MAEIGKQIEPFGHRTQRIARRFLRHENAVLLGILAVIMIVLAAMTGGKTAVPRNVTNIWLQSSGRGIAAVGQTFVILTAGIDVSIGGVALVAAIVGAKLMTGTTGFPTGAIAIMLLVGIAFGVVNGSLVSRIGMPALIVTLGMWRITDGLSLLLTGGKTIHNLPDSVSFLGNGFVGPVPVPTIIFIAVAVVAYLILQHTTFGRSVYAVGGNPVSAYLSGIDAKRILFLVFVISGFLGAVAGVISMARAMVGSMSTVLGLELDSIAASVIGGVSLMGGRGTLVGAVIGSIIIGVINNGMSVIALDPAYQDVAKGAIIIAAVAVDYLRRR